MMASASRSLISSVAAAVARRSILFHDRSTSLEQPRPAPPAPYRGGAGGVGAVEREYNFTVRAATGPDRSHCEHRRRRGRRMINRIGPSDAMTHRTFGFRVSAPQWSAAAGSSSGCSIGRPYTACQGMTNGRPAVRATWTVAGLACTAASCFRSVGGSPCAASERPGRSYSADAAVLPGVGVVRGRPLAASGRTLLHKRVALFLYPTCCGRRCGSRSSRSRRWMLRTRTTYRTP